MTGSYLERGTPVNGTVYVCNLPEGTDDNMLAEHFGTIGLLKKDKRTGCPKIWIYQAKETNEPKGDDTVLRMRIPRRLWLPLNGSMTEFHRSVIGVHIADKKSKDDVGAGPPGALLDDGMDLSGGVTAGRDQGDAGGKSWKLKGDCLCPMIWSVDVISVSNSSFMNPFLGCIWKMEFHVAISVPNSALPSCVC